MKHRNHKNNSNLWVIGITVILTVLIIAVIALAGGAPEQNNINANTSTSQLQISDSIYDLGVVSMAKGKVTKSFTLKNNTVKTIIAKKLYTSCMCTQATLTIADRSFGPFGMPAHGAIPEINANIEPGQEVKIEAVFDPAAHGPAGVGPIERQVTLETSDGQSIFKFKAQVAP